jgi:hypothetical protein
MSDPIDPLIDQQPLVAPARPAPVPPGLVATRLALHRLAEEVISPARREATGKIGLRATPGGFGTPPFGDGDQVRVEGVELVFVAHGVVERREPIDGVDAETVAFIADWFAFGASALLGLRESAGPAAEPSMIQLWPEHFDIALELGSEAPGARAAYGFSPGDEGHDAPYVYVAPWNAPPEGPLWNATGFKGAELPYASMLAAADPRQLALDFLTERLGALISPGGSER